MRTLQERKRREILAAAAAVFAARGFHRALMDDVAARAGIGKGTIYRYFTDKEELFFSILDAGMNQLHVQLERAAGLRSGPDRKLAAMVGTLADFSLRNRPLIKLLPEIEHEQVRKRVKWIHRQNHTLVSLLEREISAGIKAGLFRPGDARTWAMMVTMMVRMAFGPFDQGKPPTRDRVVRTVLDLFFHGIIKGEQSGRHRRSRTVSGRRRPSTTTEPT